MSRIVFIAPDKPLFLQGKKIIEELGLTQKVEIYLARLKRAVRLARALQHADVDVIVSRGGTARLIMESNVLIPIVEIPITGQDLAQSFYEAKKVATLENPRVAILAFKNMAYDIEVLSDILGIKLSILPLERTEDIPSKLEGLSIRDVDVVIGGTKTVSVAKQKGFLSLPVRSGDFSIRTAFLEAEKIALGRKIEKERAQEFKVLVDYSIQGIISTDRQKVVRVFNPTAERLLNLDAKDIIGKKLESSLSFIEIEACLSEGKESFGQIANTGNGWIMLNVAPIIVDEAILGAIITFQDITRIQEMEMKIRNEVMAKKLMARYRFEDIVGVSQEITETKRIAREIAQVDATVLITGESGTGKELFAQSIHNESPRRNGPFIAINCAALPPNLLESELFGYVEGAFTGATKKGKAGVFEMAHRGTIFLDEISEMDKYGQSRLLRVLQEKQVMRLGDDKYIPVDVRILAATNQELPTLVREGQFRQDLYYRLKVLTVDIPPLRNRHGDVGCLAKRFLEYYNEIHGRQVEITDEALNRLAQHDWPGNVRELVHFIERLVVIAGTKRLDEQDIEKYLDVSEIPKGTRDASWTTTEEGRIRSALQQCNANITRTAQQLGMDRSTLYRKLKMYKIEVKKNY
ncbi:sigma-54-dependent Fis family transcriptional regulator [Ammoniphilus sp. YIM 78166]|uniref:sigma-54-dependent Fis family transcriptional regulator n=1 Tax=Ammoniphilus sp. YIM 78166 TaxID=1644106 RepID=UPI0010702147|nr:sigma-54-dependent Fis family transcriptional regulator [Ammoniphilus sp. YIM 78166]